MNPLLRIDGHLLAYAEGERWRSEWCVARRQPTDLWQFGKGTLLQPKHDGRENNGYFDTLEPYEVGSSESDLDLAYRHLQQFVPHTEKPLTLVVAGSLQMPHLERLMGVLSALGHRPGQVLPQALLAAHIMQDAGNLRDGQYRMIELGRTRTTITPVQLEANRVTLDLQGVESFDFGFYRIMSQWTEVVAEQFATTQRFDLHRNLATNREKLFIQMCLSHGNEEGAPVLLALDTHQVRLDIRELRVEWPSSMNIDRASDWLVPPLFQEFRLPLQQMGVPPACPEASAETIQVLLCGLAASGDEGPKFITQLEG